MFCGSLTQPLAPFALRQVFALRLARHQRYRHPPRHPRVRHQACARDQVTRRRVGCTRHVYRLAPQTDVTASWDHSTSVPLVRTWYGGIDHKQVRPQTSPITTFTRNTLSHASTRPFLLDSQAFPCWKMLGRHRATHACWVSCLLSYFLQRNISRESQEKKKTTMMVHK